MSIREGIVGRIRQRTSAARGRLESVLLALREFPYGADRAPIAAAVEAALDGLARLSEMDPEQETFFPALDEAKKRVGEARALLDPLGGTTPVVRSRDRLRATEEHLGSLREASIDALVALEDRHLRSGPEAGSLAAAEPFRASVGEPAHHDVLRAPPRILLDLYPEPEHEVPDDSEDVPDEPPRPPPPAPLGPEDAMLVDHARAMARDCLYEIGTLSGLRAPLPEAPWTHGEPFEQRLLASLDALHALALRPSGLPDAWSLFEEVQRYAREAPTVDPGREFARALTFACARGESALRGVALSLKQAHPATIPAQREALCLSRHPATAALMRELLAEQDSLLLRFGVEVLRFQRRATVPDLAPLTGHPDPRVRAAALRALGFVAERDTAAETLAEAIEDEDDPRAALAAAEALVRLGRVEGLTWARDRLSAEAPADDADLRYGAMRLVAIAGSELDIERLIRAFGVAPREATLLGLFGHPAMVDPLLRALMAGNRLRRSTGPWVHPLEVAAAEALARITGVVLQDEHREVNDYDVARGPTIHAESWAHFWGERGAEYPAVKLRFGRPFTPAATLAELAGPSLTSLRDDLELELAICLREAALEPGDWVARQRAAIAACQEGAKARGFTPGAFLGARLAGGASPVMS